MNLPYIDPQNLASLRIEVEAYAEDRERSQMKPALTPEEVLSRHEERIDTLQVYLDSLSAGLDDSEKLMKNVRERLSTLERKVRRSDEIMGRLRQP